MAYDPTLNTSNPGETDHERDIGPVRLTDEQVGDTLPDTPRKYWRAWCNGCGSNVPFDDAKYMEGRGFCCKACRT